MTITQDMIHVLIACGAAFSAAVTLYILAKAVKELYR